MFRNVTVALLIGVAVLLSADVLMAREQKPRLIVIQAVTTADAEAARGEVNVVTADDRFVRVRLLPNAAISRAKTRLSFGELKRGCKITCKGNWDARDDAVYCASYIFVGSNVSETDIRDRVAAACQKIANGGKTQSSSWGKTGTRSPVRVEKPQLELIDWQYCQAGLTSFVNGCVKNLTERPLTGLVATVDYYSKDGKYITSSVPIGDTGSEHIGRDLPVYPGSQSSLFIIRTDLLPNEYPDVPAKCIVRFTCTNLGDLRANPAESHLVAR